MSIFLQTYPEQATDNGVSYWNAAFNPIRFLFLRLDRSFATVTDVSGFARFNQLTTPPTGAVVGTPIWARSFNGGYNVAGVITAISGNNVTTDIPYSVNEGGGLIYPTIIKNWRAEIIIDKWDGSAYVAFAELNGRNIPNGDTPTELNEYLKAAFVKSYNYIENSSNYADATCLVRYRVRYRENYLGATPGAYQTVVDGDDVDIDFFAVNAAMQRTVNWNMADYLLQIPLAATYAKFLSEFEEPSYWVGLPFDLSILWDLPLTGIGYVKRGYDINKVVQDSTGDTLNDNEGEVNRFNPQDGIDFSQYDYLSYQANIIIPSPFEVRPLTEEKFIRRKYACGKNEVLLTWRNSLGGWDYWLFENRQFIDTVINNGGDFQPYVNAPGFEEQDAILLNKNAYDVLTLGASHLDNNDVQGLKGLIRSGEVYIVSYPVLAYERVILQANTWQLIDTDRNLTELEFKLKKTNQTINI